MVVYRSFNQLLRMSVGRISPQMDDQHDRIVNRGQPFIQERCSRFRVRIKSVFLARWTM